MLNGKPTSHQDRHRGTIKLKYIIILDRQWVFETLKFREYTLQGAQYNNCMCAEDEIIVLCFSV